MGIEMDIRRRLQKTLADWVMASKAKDEILAIFDDMLHAHEIIVEQRRCDTGELGHGCAAKALFAEIAELRSQLASFDREY